MPFKTRKQKVSAAQRRYTMAQNTLVSYKSGQSESNLANGATLEKRKMEKTKLIEENYSYVRLDLSKTVIFAGLIIAIQFFLLLII